MRIPPLRLPFNCEGPTPWPRRWRKNRPHKHAIAMRWSHRSGRIGMHRTRDWVKRTARKIDLFEPRNYLRVNNLLINPSFLIFICLFCAWCINWPVQLTLRHPQFQPDQWQRISKWLLADWNFKSETNWASTQPAKHFGYLSSLSKFRANSTKL